MSNLQFETTVNELIKLDAPVAMGTGSDLPRWQRKAMENRERGLAPSPSNNRKTPSRGATKTPSRRRNSKQTPSKTPPAKKTGKTPGREPLKQHQGGDRFIPNRALMDYDLSHFKLTQGDQPTFDDEMHEADEVTTYNATAIKDHLGDHKDAKILTFKQRAPKAQEGYSNNLKVLYSSTQDRPKKPTSRFIPQTAERILDAPELHDDFYLNLMSWSSKNILSIALGNAVYLWNANSGEIDHLFQLESPGDYISSVQWLQDTDCLAVGNSMGQVLLWDVSKPKCLRCMAGHPARVGSLAWNSYILSSGGRAGNIHHHDVRIADHLVASIEGHTQEVCGMAWSPDFKYIATGGNDNVLNIWDSTRALAGSEPLYSLAQHQAAVKAISWCPWQPNVLGSGGGTADRTIRFWNAQSGLCMKTTDAKSQVSGILWSREHKELITGHGFAQNQLTIWKYVTMERICDLKGHTSRVLAMCLSPDGTTVVSAGADETLRFWNCFAHLKKTKKPSTSSRSSEPSKALITRTIR
ncbi:cell division cycle protein 20 homolog [Lytechinus variegatus]|uniref:cell division cycle protein 20 homolog n=1 Tax=Lytechinus variegatus TaxID=7654 RepID=UPI001BB203EB|nr:cell division cycle protein 20 homolog [Lytechinus variegatus]